MNSLVFFSLIMLTMLRAIGLVVSIHFTLQLKEERFKFFILGWFFWFISGILPILSDMTTNDLLSGVLFESNKIFTLIALLYLIMGVFMYFREITYKYKFLVPLIFPSFYILTAIITDVKTASLFILILNFLVMTIPFIFGFIERKRINNMIGNSIVWFYLSAAIYFFLLVIVSFIIIEGHGYGLYQSNNEGLIIINYSLTVVWTLVLIILFIHTEYNFSKFDLQESRIELDKSEEKYKSLISSIPAVTWISNKKGETTFISPNVERIYGFSPEEILKAGAELWFKRIHQDDIDKVKLVYEKHFKNQEAFDIEYRVQRKDGIWIWLHDKAIVQFKDGKEEFTYGVFMDVTQQKKIEEELKESEDRYRKLFESTPVAILISDLQGRIVTYNKQMLNQSGYSEEEFSKLQADSLYTNPNDRKMLLESLQRDGQIREYEVEVINKEGNIRSAILNIDLIEIEGEKFLLTTSLDITERKEVEAVKSELERRRDDFISMTTHELRTPLTIIKGYLELLMHQEREYTTNQRLTIYNTVQKNVKRLERLIVDSRSISAIDHNAFELNFSEVLINELLEQVIKPHHDLYGEDFELQNSKDSSILINGDKERLQQVFDNIIENALHNTHKNSRKIKITVEIENKYINILFQDNGVGIEPKNLEKIFEKFVSIPTDTSVTGTGVGLFLAREIIDKHGGTIHAESEGKGFGTTIVIQLPIKEIT